MPLIERNPKLKSKVIKVGGKPWRVWEMPPRSALRACFRLAKMFGPQIASLISGAGLEVTDEHDQPLLDDKGEPIRLPFAAVLASEHARRALAKRLLGALASLDVDDLMAIVDEMLVGHTDVDPLAAGGWISVSSVEALEGHLAGSGIMGLFDLLRASLGLTGFPISAGQPTAGDGSQGLTGGGAG